MMSPNNRSFPLLWLDDTRLAMDDSDKSLTSERHIRLKAKSIAVVRESKWQSVKEQLRQALQRIQELESEKRELNNELLDARKKYDRL